MGKIILLLEDDAYLNEHTAIFLRDAGYTVEEFHRIDQAKKFYKKNQENIKCIVTDLNMSDEWLGEYRSESFGRILSGWVWLHRFVYKSNKPDIPTVIFSGFLDELRSVIPPDQRSLLKSKYIECVSKGSDDDEGISGLLIAIERVINWRKKNDERK